MDVIDCSEQVPERAGFGPIVRCNAPAEVVRTWLVESTGGMTVHAEVRCVLGHYLRGPMELVAAEVS